MSGALNFEVFTNPALFEVFGCLGFIGQVEIPKKPPRTDSQSDLWVPLYLLSVLLTGSVLSGGLLGMEKADLRNIP